ncbi:thioredoxin family protein [Desulfuromonas versatilis]|uniref:Thioredoxin family protein n=1 Tax=Desulfuromonas versatilis TaxID=2802975 RepID=A0ABN6DZB9_9BACT|nr:thioredoxin family protein [Desulfuromonas versatilis]BCR04854.1 thioredoxin family protein [Desulfuromonas versatilis]
MTIELLGDNCWMCRRLEKNIREAVEATHIQAEYQRVEDPERMVEYGLLSLPGLSIDGKLVSAGKLLSTRTLEKMLAPQEPTGPEES